MDFNLVIVCGRLAVAPEYRTFESGSNLVRLLVTVRSDTPSRRIDLIPVVKWNPSDDLVANRLVAGQRVWVTGWLERRFWDGEDSEGRSSRLEILAHDVVVKDPEDDLAGV